MTTCRSHLLFFYQCRDWNCLFPRLHFFLPQLSFHISQDESHDSKLSTSSENLVEDKQVSGLQSGMSDDFLTAPRFSFSFLSSVSSGEEWRLVQRTPEEDSQSIRREDGVAGDLALCGHAMIQPEDLHFLHQTSFSVFQDREAQKELSASNDDLSESNAAKVSSRAPHKQANKQTITEERSLTPKYFSGEKHF